MSLIAWWKLNGDLLDSSGNGNHGNINGDALVYSDGIVGKAGNFDGNKNIVIQNTDFLLSKLKCDFTICFFIKPTVDYIAIRDVFCLGRDINSGINIRTEVDEFIYASLFTDKGRWSVGIGVVFNVWNHIVFRFSNKGFQIFLNGVLAGSITEADGTIIYPEVYGGLCTLASHGANIYKYLGQLQDFRIYDHCLSDKEIYELSKAKVLHYTFDDVEEPTVNLAATGTISSVAYCDPINLKADYISVRSNNSNGYIVLELNTMVEGKTYCITGKLRINGKPDCFDFRNNYITGTIEDYIDPITGEFRYIFANNPTEAGRGCLFHARKTGLSVGSLLEIANLQVEEKDHATPFVNGTRDNIVVRDKSDYGNDSLPLTISNTPAFIEDCVLGKTGIKHNKASYIVVKNNIKVKKAITMMAFIKLNEYNDGKHQTIITLAGSYYLSIESGYLESFAYGRNALYYKSSTKLSLNKWYHVVTVIELDKTYLYINGILDEVFSNNYQDDISYPEIYRLSSGLCYPTMDYTTDMFIDDIRIYATALMQNDIKAIYQSRANLDDKGNLKVVELVSIENKKRLFDYSDWNNVRVVDKVLKSGSVVLGNADDNNFVYDLDPFGKPIVVWQAKGKTAGLGNGGWDDAGSNHVVDTTKRYRYSVWVKRSVQGNGSLYFGCLRNHVATISTGVANTNPYFFNQDVHGSVSLSDWVLLIGHVHPKEYTALSYHKDSGIYDKKGIKLKDCIDYKWVAEGSKLGHRSYLYYSTDSATRQEFCYPRVDLCDGTEPSIEKLLNGYDSRNYDLYMQKGNVPNVFDLNEKGILTTYNVSELGVTEGLIAHYPLNGDAKDYSGNGNDGTVYGATVASGLGQKCYNFDGVDDIIVSTNSPSIIGSNNSPFTLSCWYSVEDTSAQRDLVNLGVLGSGAMNGFRLALNTGTGYLCAQTAISSTRYSAIETVNPTLRSMRHATAVYDGSNLSLYANGSLVSSVPASMNKPTNQLTIGNQYPLGGSYHKGKIQDVRIYNRALSPEEVLINYDMTRPDGPKMKIGSNGTTYVKRVIANNIFRKGVEEGLIAHYPLDGDARDYSLNSNNGTVVGATVSGGLGQKCYQFDGVDDKITFTLEDSLPIGTLTTWFKYSTEHNGYLISSSMGYQYLFVGSSTDAISDESLSCLGGDSLNSWTVNLIIRKGMHFYKDNKWHHVAFVVGGTQNSNKVYIDGSDALAENRGNVYTGLLPAGTYEIGGCTNVTGYRYNGNVQDVRIYNRALTPEEVKINYELTKPNGPKIVTSSNGKIYFKERMKTVN